MSNNQNKEFSLLRKYNVGNSKSYIENIMHSLANNHIDNSDDTVDVIDLSLFRDHMNEFMEYLVILKRFRNLRKSFNCKLQLVIYTSETDHFELDGHKFYTLDEVEKCLNNKSFL